MSTAEERANEHFLQGEHGCVTGDCPHEYQRECLNAAFLAGEESGRRLAGEQEYHPLTNPWRLKCGRLTEDLELAKGIIREMRTSLTNYSKSFLLLGWPDFAEGMNEIRDKHASDMKRLLGDADEKEKG